MTTPPPPHEAPLGVYSVRAEQNQVPSEDDVVAVRRLSAHLWGQAPLGRVEDGLCEDGCGNDGQRYLYGRFGICLRCARRRMNADPVSANILIDSEVRAAAA
jgi:hypothetical protein